MFTIHPDFTATNTITSDVGKVETLVMEIIEGDVAVLNFTVKITGDSVAALTKHVVDLSAPPEHDRAIKV